MMKRLFVAVALLLAVPALGRNHWQGYANQGGNTVSVAGFISTTKVQKSFPSCTISVYDTGTTSLATLYSDSSGTSKANPFTADSTGKFDFYSDLSSVDITFSGTGITTPFTWSDMVGGAAGNTASTFSVLTYGAKGDLRTVTDGSISISTTALSSLTGAFTSADVGKQIQISGAGTAGATLYTTISAYVSSTAVTIATPAITGVSGATVKVYTDDGAAVIAAAAALIANGGGTLLFPATSPEQTYGMYGSGTVYNNLATFTSLTGINLECDGCKLFFSGDHTLTSYGPVFTFYGSSNIKIDGFTLIGETTKALTRTGSFDGIKFVSLQNGTSNVDIPSLVASGIGEPLESTNSNSGIFNSLPIPHGIHVGVMKVTNCIYGFNGQFGPTDMVVDNLTTDTVTRSFFVYGASNIFLNVHSKDSYGDDVLLDGFQGRGNSNIHINYASGSDSTDRGDGGAMVAIGFDWNVAASPSAVTNRNIFINYDVVFPGQGTANTGENALMIRKTTSGGTGYDTTDRGHILDGLTITGRIENYGNSGGFGIFDQDINSRWGATLDSWYNINLHNLTLYNSSYQRWTLRALKGTFSINNLYSHNVNSAISDVILQQDSYYLAPDTGFPQSGKIQILNSSFDNLYTLNGVTGSLAAGMIQIGADSTIYTGWQDQHINNIGCGATCTLTLPSAVIGRSYTAHRVVAQALRLAPQAADQIRGASAVNKYISIDTTGASATLTCYVTGVWDVQYYAPAASFSFQP